MRDIAISQGAGMVNALDSLAAVDPLGKAPSAGFEYHLYVYGMHEDPYFHMYQVAAQSLTQDFDCVQATVECFHQTQYQQKLESLQKEFGGAFLQADPSTSLVYCEVDSDKVLFFQNDKRFLAWAQKRFQYEDNTHFEDYKEMAKQAVGTQKEEAGRSYCAIGLQIGEEPQETIQLELFDEECPQICKNFLDLLSHANFNGHLVHRVKAGAWMQCGDLKDGSGLNSNAVNGGYLRHESFTVTHDTGGLLGMANHGKDTNGSQFYITMKALPFLDGTRVIFGRVVSGMSTIEKVGQVKTKNERPVEDIKVFALPEHTFVGPSQGSR